MSSRLPSPAGAQLELTTSHRAELAARARRAYPREACGLLLGRSAEGLTRVEHVREARNLAAATSPTRFELDPVDHLAAEEEARALGLEVVGLWHSHPDQPPQPSRADERDAWHGWSFLIVAVEAHGLAELGSWRFVDGRFVAEPVRLLGSPAGATPGGLHRISARR